MSRYDYVNGAIFVSKVWPASGGSLPLSLHLLQHGHDLLHLRLHVLNFLVNGSNIGLDCRQIRSWLSCNATCSTLELIDGALQLFALLRDLFLHLVHLLLRDARDLMNGAGPFVSFLILVIMLRGDHIHEGHVGRVGVIRLKYRQNRRHVTQNLNLSLDAVDDPVIGGASKSVTHHSNDHVEHGQVSK